MDATPVFSFGGSLWQQYRNGSARIFSALCVGIRGCPPECGGGDSLGRKQDPCEGQTP